MKLYMVTKKLSAKLASETEFYIDFKPLTFGPFLKKTLYIFVEMGVSVKSRNV